MSRYFRLFILAAALAVASSMNAVFASNASASPVKPDRASDGGTATVDVEASSVGSFSFTLKGTILEDVKLKGTKLHSNKCRWTNGWNSGRSVDGHLNWFWDTHMWVCPNPNSPTKWAKAGGGKTGRNCGNPVQIRGPPPGPVVNVVTMVRSFSKIHIVVKAEASAKVSGTCPNNGASGSAEASALVQVVIDQKMVVQAKGNAADLRAIVKNSLIVQAEAMAMAKLHLSCPLPPPPTPTPPPPCTQNCGGPPPCTVNCNPPPPTCPPGTTGTPPHCVPTTTATGVCTGLGLGHSGLTATATVNVATSGGATASGAHINWGDGTDVPITLDGASTTRQHTYANSGTFNVVATVTFNGGPSPSSCSGTVTVTSPPPPNHSCLITPVQNKDGMSYDVMVGVDAPSAGPNGTINWGDGSPASPGLQGSHTYGAAGSYPISAFVTFNDGGSASCSTTVSAQSAPPPPPPPSGYCRYHLNNSATLWSDL